MRARRVPVVGDGLIESDYASSFEISTAAGHAGCPPDRWARAMLEDAPRALRWFVVLGWKTMLRLRLGPIGSPDHVLGWPIATSTADAITLEVSSPLITARKVVRVAPTRVTVTTHVRYQRRPARVIWSIVAPVHHRTEPLHLTMAASRLQSPTI